MKRKSYIVGLFVCMGWLDHWWLSIVFSLFFFCFSGQTNFELSKKDEKFYKSKGWMRALYDLEMNLGDRIDSLSRLLSLEVNDIESDIKLINERLKSIGE